MWLLFAFASALFAGATSILAKIGIKNVDANLATALRTLVVLVFAWLMVLIVGSQTTIPDINMKSLAFLLLSGLASGGSWLYYFKALQIGDVNKVVPVDKSSTVMTMLLAFLLLGEDLTPLKIGAMFLIGIGTYLMIEKKESVEVVSQGRKAIVYALISALFASLTAIFGKIGVAGVESNLGTAIRTVVVALMAWLIVFWQGGQRRIHAIDRRSWLFLVLSGLATGLSWLCYYRALKDGLASVVVPIDKLSILVTVAFGYLVFKEKLTQKSATGLIMIVVGTLCLLL